MAVPDTSHLRRPAILFEQIHKGRITGLHRGTTAWQPENSLLRPIGLSSNFRYLITIEGPLSTCSAHVEVIALYELLDLAGSFPTPSLHTVPRHPDTACTVEVKTYDRYIPASNSYAYDILIRLPSDRWPYRGQIQVPAYLLREVPISLQESAVAPELRRRSSQETAQKRKREIEDAEDNESLSTGSSSARSFVWSGKAARQGVKRGKERECSICTEMKAVADFPADLGEGHRHTSDMCLDCWQAHLLAQVESLAINDVGCPHCTTALGEQAVQNVATKETLRV